MSRPPSQEAKERLRQAAGEWCELSVAKRIPVVKGRDGRGAGEGQGGGA
jgi:hypothetical protein